jgi:hypothetical protein
MWSGAVDMNRWVYGDGRPDRRSLATITGAVRRSELPRLLPPLAGDYCWGCWPPTPLLPGATPPPPPPPPPPLLLLPPGGGCL